MGELSKADAYTVFAIASKAVSVTGITALCAKLVHRGIFDASDINGIFDAMVGSVPKVPGTEEDAQDTIEGLNRRRQMLAEAADRRHVIE